MKNGRFGGTFLSILLICVILACTAFALQDIDELRGCCQCGMDRKAYGFSRMLIRYADGSTSGLCSLHCAVLDMQQHRHTTASSILVADRDSHELIAAETAHWVLGGSKRGVMTALAKWAFARPAAAERFVADYGGRLSSWQAALEAARLDTAPRQRP